MKQVEIDTDYLETLTKQIKALTARVNILENDSTPTVPQYDNTNFPSSPVEGQLAIGNDGNLYKYIGGAWSTVGGAAPWHGGRYTGGTGNALQNATVSFPLSLGFGDALLDLTTPAVPVFIAGGVYVISAAVRCVIALGGAQTAGSTFAGGITITSSTGGMGQNVSQVFTWGSGGSFVPIVTVNSVPINVNAGDHFTVSATNSDSVAGSHTYDAQSIWVVKLS